jgi:putative SOS response-associated peptidase YedK
MLRAIALRASAGHALLTSTHRSFYSFVWWARWERWQKGDEDETLSCTLITTNPNDVVGAVHNRMPVILPISAYDQWLHTATKDAGGLTELLRPYRPKR